MKQYCPLTLLSAATERWAFHTILDGFSPNANVSEQPQTPRKDWLGSSLIWLATQIRIKSCWEELSAANTWVCLIGWDQKSRQACCAGGCSRAPQSKRYSSAILQRHAIGALPGRRGWLYGSEDRRCWTVVWGSLQMDSLQFLTWSLKGWVLLHFLRNIFQMFLKRQSYGEKVSNRLPGHLVLQTAMRLNSCLLNLNWRRGLMMWQHLDAKIQCSSTALSLIQLS